MHPVDLVVCLLIALVALVTVAHRLNVSYPIVLVIGGLVLALFPRLPEVRLDPDVVFLVFLPPLLYWDALNSSWRDFRDNWRPNLAFVDWAGLYHHRGGNARCAFYTRISLGLCVRPGSCFGSN